MNRMRTEHGVQASKKAKWLQGKSQATELRSRGEYTQGDEGEGLGTIPMSKDSDWARDGHWGQDREQVLGCFFLWVGGKYKL